MDGGNGPSDPFSGIQWQALARFQGRCGSAIEINTVRNAHGLMPIFVDDGSFKPQEATRRCS